MKYYLLIPLVICGAVEKEFYCCQKTFPWYVVDGTASDEWVAERKSISPIRIKQINIKLPPKSLASIRRESSQSLQCKHPAAGRITVTTTLRSGLPARL